MSKDEDARVIALVFRLAGSAPEPFGRFFDIAARFESACGLESQDDVI